MNRPLSRLVAVLTPRRRWAQFSLGTMFVFVTVLCVWLAVVVNRANRQREAVAAIERSGGQAYYDFQVACLETSIAKDGSCDQFTIELDDDSAPADPEWLTSYFGLDFFHDVAFANISEAEIDESDINMLRQALPHCHFLHRDGVWMPWLHGARP